MGMQIGLVAEELPVGVLCTGVDHRLVRIIQSVLQVQQLCRQAYWQIWLPTARPREQCQGGLESRPSQLTRSVG